MLPKGVPLMFSFTVDEEMKKYKPVFSTDSLIYWYTTMGIPVEYMIDIFYRAIEKWDDEKFLNILNHDLNIFVKKEGIREDFGSTVQSEQCQDISILG